MRISVVHSTVYQYDGAVYLEPHTFRLRPRGDASQNLIQYAMNISPAPAGQAWRLDQDGNAVLDAWFREPVGELSVMSSFQVETLRENPFDFLSLRAGLDERERATLGPYCGAASGRVEEYARLLGGADVLSFLAALNGRLYEDFAHTVRDEGDPEAPDDTLDKKSGTCRDLAVLFCEAARSRGIPSRFVSGYEREAAIQEKAHMHAWAEVYVAGGGWRGYDPSQGLAVSTSHVALAAAADPLGAAPVSGTYRGAAAGRMEYSISMMVG